MLTLITTFLFILSNVQAQDINEQDKIMSLGSKNAFVIDHPRATEKMATKAWEDYMKQYGKAKKNRKAKEHESLGANVNLVSSNSLDIYYIVEKGNEQVSTYIFFDDGEKFISSENDSEKVDGIFTFLTPYVYEVEKLVIQEDLDLEENNLKGLNKDLSKLEKDNKNMHDDIEDWKRKIAEAEEKIEQNLEDQENKKMEILSQEEQVEKVRDNLNSIGKG